ncbi:MAG: hypothetical protein ACTSRZ_04195 [Promethearchaeota archaeon]
MSEDISESIRQTLMRELAKIEEKSDLKQMSILSRSGMKIASAKSAEIDVDPISGSSAALIDVGGRFNNKMQHGNLREIIIRAPQGYTILMYINNEYMTFAGLSNIDRIGYYLEFLRVKCKYFSYILAGGVVTEELKEEIEKEKKTQEEEELALKDIFEKDVSSEQDISAMQDVLNFLNDWGGDDVDKADDNAIVGIDEDIIIMPEIESEQEQSTPLPSKTIKTTDKQSSFKVYDDEIPPIPLDDYVSLFEAAPSEEYAEQIDQSNNVEEYVSQETSQTATNTSKQSSKPPNASGFLTFDDMPNFDEEYASEYDDVDLDLSEDDAFIEALEDLGYVDLEEEKKKKSS